MAEFNLFTVFGAARNFDTPERCLLVQLVQDVFILGQETVFQAHRGFFCSDEHAVALAGNELAVFIRNVDTVSQLHTFIIQEADDYSPFTGGFFKFNAADGVAIGSQLHAGIACGGLPGGFRVLDFYARALP